MRRAKLSGLRRSAAVVLGDAGAPEDADVLTRALDGPEPLVREHTARALARYAGRQPASASLLPVAR
jgi:HEAT repeat protein